jgi:hypothetical protein
MPEPELFLLFVRPLNRAGIRYVVTGSVAAIFYGEPRLTHDVDFVVFLTDADVQALAKLFPAADFYLPPAEIISTEARREQRDRRSHNEHPFAYRPGRFTSLR